MCHILGIKRLMIPCRAAPESVLKSDGQVERAAIALSVGMDHLVSHPFKSAAAAHPSVP